MKKLFRRIITVAILAPIVVGIINFDIQPYGTLPFLVFIISVTVMSLNEYFHMASTENDPFFLTGHFLSITWVLCAFVAELKWFWDSPLAFLVSMGFLGVALVELTSRKLLYSKFKVFITYKSVGYIGWFYSYFILIRNLPYGKALIFYVLFTVWAVDISAYVIGMTFGKHKLIPQISPKKSKEGAVAGFIAAMVASFILLFVSWSKALPHVSVHHSLILGGLIGILSQVGDIYESLVKRTYGAKDSSNILPGHGGILDRADSFILLAPVVYYYFIYLVFTG